MRWVVATLPGGGGGGGVSKERNMVVGEKRREGEESINKEMEGVKLRWGIYF